MEEVVLSKSSQKTFPYTKGHPHAKLYLHHTQAHEWQVWYMAVQQYLYPGDYCSIWAAQYKYSRVIAREAQGVGEEGGWPRQLTDVLVQGISFSCLRQQIAIEWRSGRLEELKSLFPPLGAPFPCFVWALCLSVCLWHTGLLQTVRWSREKIRGGFFLPKKISHRAFKTAAQNIFLFKYKCKQSKENGSGCIGKTPGCASFRRTFSFSPVYIKWQGWSSWLWTGPFSSETSENSELCKWTSFFFINKWKSSITKWNPSNKI